MREITPRDVIAWQNEMRKCESQDGEKYKGIYLRKMQAELSAIFNHAVKYYELPKNPAIIAGPLGQHHADEMQFWITEIWLHFLCIRKNAQMLEAMCQSIESWWSVNPTRLKNNPLELTEDMISSLYMDIIKKYQ